MNRNGKYTNQNDITNTKKENLIPNLIKESNANENKFKKLENEYQVQNEISTILFS